jgi:hypothetical protein
MLISRLSWLLALSLVFPTSAISSVETDPAAGLYEKADQILAQSDRLAQIWPSYWPEWQGFILYDPAHGALFVGANGQPRKIDYRAGELPAADAAYVFDYPAGTPNMILVRVENKWSERLATLFHEQFHDFQNDAFDKADRRHGGEYVELNAISDRAHFTAAAELERRVLADALLAESDEQREDLTRRYLALRRAREATVGDSILTKERYLERWEGTAQYVGFMARAMVLGRGTDDVANNLAEGLRRDLFADADRSYSSNWFRWRAYDVGGAIAMLLDRSGANWKRQVEAGQPLDLILEKTLGKADNAERDRLAVATRTKYGSPQLLKDMRASLAAAPRTLESTSDFLALGARKLVLEITIPRERFSDSKQFSATRKMIAVGPRAIAFLDVDEFGLERPGISLKIKGLSIMEETLSASIGEPFTHRYTVALRDDFNLGLLGNLSSGSHVLERIGIAVEGLILKIDQSSTVAVEDDQITISTSVSRVRE